MLWHKLPKRTHLSPRRSQAFAYANTLTKASPLPNFCADVLQLQLESAPAHLFSYVKVPVGCLNSLSRLSNCLKSLPHFLMLFEILLPGHFALTIHQPAQTGFRGHLFRISVAHGFFYLSIARLSSFVPISTQCAFIATTRITVLPARFATVAEHVRSSKLFIVVCWKLDDNELTNGLIQSVLSLDMTTVLFSS